MPAVPHDGGVDDVHVALEHHRSFHTLHPLRGPPAFLIPPDAPCRPVAPQRPERVYCLVMVTDHDMVHFVRPVGVSRLVLGSRRSPQRDRGLGLRVCTTKEPALDVGVVHGADGPFGDDTRHRGLVREESRLECIGPALQELHVVVEPDCELITPSLGGLLCAQREEQRIPALTDDGPGRVDGGGPVIGERGEEKVPPSGREIEVPGIGGDRTMYTSRTSSLVSTGIERPSFTRSQTLRVIFCVSAKSKLSLSFTFTGHVTARTSIFKVQD